MTFCCTSGFRRALDGPASSSRSGDAITVVVAGVAGQIGYALVPMIANGDFFGPSHRVIIKGLDLNFPATRDTMKGIKYELQDGNFPLLDKVFMSVDEREAFSDADYAVLLGSWPPKGDAESKKDVMEKNVMIFKTMGKALDKHAKKDCKVIVFGTPASTNTLICSHYAPSIPKSNFTAVTCLQLNRAVGQIAHRAGVSVGDVKKLIVWGGSCAGCTYTGQFIDTEHCEIQGKKLAEVLSKDKDKKWLADVLPEEVKHRGREVIAARKASAAMSAARAVCDHVHSLHCGTRRGELACFGIWTDSKPYDVVPGLYVSLPVVCQGKGQVVVERGLSLSKSVRDQLKQSEKDLIEERDLAQHFFAKQL